MFHPQLDDITRPFLQTDTDLLIFRGFLILGLEDTNIDESPVFTLLNMIDLQGQSDIVEDGRPLSGECRLLQVNERGDDLPLVAVEVFSVQQLHHGLPHGVTGAGGDGALAGGGRCGPGGSRDLVWVGNSKVK